MLCIPSALQAQFQALLRNKAVPDNAQSSYLKWLRFYLDFCEKYRFPFGQGESLGRFLRKLQEKKQSETQREQASHAILLYHELIQSGPPQNEVRSAQRVISLRRAFPGCSQSPASSQNEAKN